MKKNILIQLHCSDFFSNISWLDEKIQNLCQNHHLMGVLIVKGGKLIRDHVATKYGAWSTTSCDVCDLVANIVLDSQLSEFREVFESMSMSTPFCRYYQSDLAVLSNIKKGQDYDVYIGRGSIYGNPYHFKEVGTREESIRMHKYDYEFGLLHRHDEIIASVPTLIGKRLGCHCYPLDCHGDVYIRDANRLVVPHFFLRSLCE